jgi:hypothetical protein
MGLGPLLHFSWRIFSYAIAAAGRPKPPKGEGHEPYAPRNMHCISICYGLAEPVFIPDGRENEFSS